MELTAGAWTPANDVERALRDAVQRADVAAYRRILGGATLILPVSPAAAGGAEPVRWGTAQHDGRTYVIAFTSPAAMVAGVGADTTSYREAPLADLADAWPDQRAWLAVDLGTPLQALLDPAAVAEAAWVGERETNPVEAVLRSAARAADQTAYAAGLLGAEMVLPLRPDASPSRDLTDPLFSWWYAQTAEGAPAIVAYTSVPRLRAGLGEQDWIAVDFTALADAWPDPACALAVNPGTPVGGLIAGSAVRGLADLAARALLSAAEAAESAAQDPNLGEDDRELAAHQAARDAVARVLRG